MRSRLLAGLLLGTMLATPLSAQDNMDKLTNMQRTDATFTEIPQTGPTADALQDIGDALVATAAHSKLFRVFAAEARNPRL